MKIIFGYYDDEDFGLTEYPEIIQSEKNEEVPDEEYEQEKEKVEQYRKYLVTGIMEDFQYPESCDEVLVAIKDIENGKSFGTEWDGQAFQHEITPHYVQFVHTIFGDSEEYPVWTCRLKEYKKVLHAWKSFLELPKDLESRIEVSV